MRGEFATFGAKFVDRNLVLVQSGGAVFFFDFPFDGQAVAIPAGHIIGVAALHLFGPVDDILQDLVERMSDMQVSVGVGRSVMQDERVASPGLGAQLAPQIHGLPTRQQFGLPNRQPGFHGKVGARQEYGVFIIRTHCTVSIFGKLVNSTRI